MGRVRILQVLFGDQLIKMETLIGNYNADPILNTGIYDIEFQDGVIQPYSASFIAQTILNQVDNNGCHSQMLDYISDY